MHFANSVTIRRPASEVFAFLVDPANIPKWNYAIDSARQISPGPVGVGTRIQQTRSVPRPATEELLITELVLGRRMVLEGDIGPLSGTRNTRLSGRRGAGRNQADQYRRSVRSRAVAAARSIGRQSGTRCGGRQPRQAPQYPRVIGLGTLGVGNDDGSGWRSRFSRQQIESCARRTAAQRLFTPSFA